MDFLRIQSLIAQNRILDPTSISLSDVYVQVGVYQYPNNRRSSGDFNTYASYVIPLSQIGGGGGGGILSVTASSPLSSSGGANPNLTISQAGPATSGYLSAANWNTFNNKQNALGYTPEDQANKSNNTALGTSTVLYPTQNAVKTYVDGSVTGLLDDRGNWDASTNLWPSTGGSGPAGAILKGDLWYVSVGGTLGGNPVVVGNSFRALVDNPVLNTDWAILSVGLGYVPANETTQILTTSPLGGGGDLSANRTLTIQDAAANGATKGAATFNASDFNDNGSGLISIDYTNGQVASGAVNGFLSSTDWSNFNNKENALGYTPEDEANKDADATLGGGSPSNVLYPTQAAVKTYVDTGLNTKVASTRTLNTTAPLTGGGDLSANRTLAITQATTSTNGYLSSTDWNTFNNKTDEVAIPVGWLANTNIAASTTYYFGQLLNGSPTTTTSNSRRFRSPFTGNFITITFATVTNFNSSGSTWSLSLHNVTQGTSVTITSGLQWLQFNYYYTGFTLQANAGDQMELRSVNGPYTSGPTNCQFTGTIIIRKS
jgi:hypothetical protein